MAGAGEGVIYVALHEQHEAVALRQHDLPEDSEDVLNLLSSEAAPLLCWFDTAKAYLSQSKAQAFLEIVREANSDETLDGIRSYFSKEPTFERVQMFCALAAYYIEASRAERDPQRRAAALNQAEECIKDAERLSSVEMLPHMARGMLVLAKDPNNTRLAMVEFRKAEKGTHNGHLNHAPLLAQAALHYSSGELSESIQLYAKVLRSNPQCPPEVRLGIAACYYRAGKLDAAAAAYSRVLELDASSADALLGLAVIKFGSRDAQEGLNSGLQLLQRAYAADPTHPGVLCALCHFSLLKGEKQQALALAQAAFEASDTDRLRSVSLSLLGRCHHAVGDLPAAQHHYAQAIRLDPKAPLPHLGTAQVYLATGGDPTNAVSELELVLKALPGNSDALWLLGGLLPVQPARVAKTLEGHREAAQRQVNDPGLQEMLGELLAAREPAAALSAFDRALAIHRQRQQAVQEHNAARQRERQKLLEQQGDELAAELLQDIGEDQEVPQLPAKLLNNAAVLKYRAGNIAEACELLDEATKAMMTDAGTNPMQKVSMGYNMARLQEATGNLKAASDTYKQLVQQFPGYIDCYLRLSAMAKASGDLDEAKLWAAEATKQQGGHIDAQAMLASLYLERHELNAARACVDSVSSQGNKDPYMQLTHANVVLAALPPHSRKEGADRQRRDFVYKAMQMYRDVLKQQSDNIYAVNGLGTCLAELGQMEAAKHAFNEVIRATSKTKGFVKLPETYVNLGNLWLARQQYGDALKMYEHASRLNNHKNAQILLYMARACHDAGDHLAAKKALLKALHLAPADIKLRFNLAFVLQEWAVKVFKKKYVGGDTSKLKEYLEAETALAEAEKIFNHLYTLGKEATRIEPKKLHLHAQFCHKQLPNAVNLVRTAQADQERLAAEQQLRQAQLKAAEAERRHREATDSAAKKMEQAKKREEAQRALEQSKLKLTELREKRQLAALADIPEGEGGEAGGKTGGSKKRRKKGAAAEDMADFYVDDAQPIERLPKGKKDDADVRETMRRTGLDSDDEDAEAELFGAGSDEEERQQRQNGEDDYNPDDTDQTAAAAPAGGRGRLKRRTAAAAPAPAAEEEPADAGDDGGGGDGFDEMMDEAPGDDGFEVDALFNDGPAEEGGQDAAAAQPRKRQRQALESDDEEQAAAVPTENGGGADLEDDLEDLF